MENKKGNIGLVIFVILLVIFVIGIIGFLIIDNQNNQKIDKAMKKASLDYFDKYVSVTSNSLGNKITLEDLENASEDYNLKALEGCNGKKTYALITIDPSNSKVKSVEIKKNCKKW